MNNSDLDSEELKVCPVDIEIFIENSLGKDFSIGNMTDAFECNKKEAIYVTHIKPKKLIPDNFIPEFLKKEEKMKEYIFLIDRSGSMSGSLMKQAKHCLTVDRYFRTQIKPFLASYPTIASQMQVQYRIIRIPVMPDLD